MKTIKTENYSTFTLINYFDVWGNEKEGYEINNQCIECDDLIILDDASDKDILNYLKDSGYLKTSDMRHLVVENFGDNIEIYQRKGIKPLFGLTRNY